MEKSETQSKIIQTASILVVLVLFYFALWVLRREIHASHFTDVIQYIKEMPIEQFFLVFFASMGSYLALTFFMMRLGSGTSKNLLITRKSP